MLRRCGSPYYHNNYWETVLSTEIQVVKSPTAFFCYTKGGGDASQTLPIQERIYAYASYLLAYDPSSSVYWDAFKTPSGFNVLPEAQFLAFNPTIPTTSLNTYTDLEQGNLFVREYNACYVPSGGSEVYIGGCAAVVNPTTNTNYPIPATLLAKYHHQLSLSGYDVLEGGKFSTSASAAPASLNGPSNTGTSWPYAAILTP